MKLLTAILASALVLATLDAEAARRLGGGRSVGQQSGNVSRDAAPATAPTAGGGATAAAPAAAAPAATAARSAAPAAAAAAPRRPWGAMLGGLAAGLGLAWLANAMGFGAELAQFLLIGLFALLAMAVVGFILRGRRQPAFAGASGYQTPAADLARAPRTYSPDKVGNDASARPWERSNPVPFDAARSGGAEAGAGHGAGGASAWSVPADFDAAGFVAAAKRNFLSLQDAWDRSDIPALRAMMTDEMLSEIRTQLAEREKELAGQPNKTDVVLLEAQLLGVEDLGSGYLASVEFSGMVREQPSAGPSPFREVWNMTKPKGGTSGWLVAGVQALQ